MKSVQELDDPGCATFNTGVTRCSVFQKIGDAVKSVQVLDDLGCATFNMGVMRYSVFQKSRGFRQIWAGTG